MGYIYCILNKSSGKKYIGSTINVKSRKKQHFTDLRCSRHYNEYLQKSFSLHGEDDFEFFVIEQIENVHLSDREKYWIKTERTDERSYGFNLTDEPYAPMRGKTHNEDTKMLMKFKSRKGSNHPNSKYNEIQVREVFALFKNGYHQGQIEKITGIDRTNISLMLSGKAWKHLKIEPVSCTRINNKSGCVGVYYQKSTHKWKAEMIKNKKYYNLGSYDSYEEAVNARKKAEGGVLSDLK